MEYVLHIDDDGDDLSIFEEAFIKLFPRMDYRPFTSAKKALEFLAFTVELPSLIIVDPYMPGVSGMEVINLIRQEEDLKHLTIICLSISAQPPLKDSPLLFDFYYQKPSSFEDLKALVMEISKHFGKRSKGLPYLGE